MYIYKVLFSYPSGLLTKKCFTWCYLLMKIF